MFWEFVKRSKVGKERTRKRDQSQLATLPFSLRVEALPNKMCVEACGFRRYILGDSVWFHGSIVPSDPQ